MALLPTERIYVCPMCGTEYVCEGQCGQNQPYVCREELMEEEIPTRDAVDTALRAFNGWPANHPIDDAKRRDMQWVAIRRALGALVDREAFEAASKWEGRYGSTAA